MDRDTAVQKKNMMRSEFRRNSSCEHGKEVIHRGHMLTIFGRMGQPINESELDEFMDTVDLSHSGLLDYDAFTKICNRFVKDAAALAKLKGDEFIFKNLITCNDFENP